MAGGNARLRLWANALVMRLEEEIVSLATFDGLCADSLHFEVHQRHLPPKFCAEGEPIEDAHRPNPTIKPEAVSLLLYDCLFCLDPFLDRRHC
eukprot:scaffold22767_cov18-Prasinocladus_malaysianus.AAC.1